MFPGLIDSRQVRAGSTSGTRSRRRTSERDAEVANLQEQLRQQEEIQKAQQEALRQQQEYFAAQIAQQQAMIQVRLDNISLSVCDIQ